MTTFKYKSKLTFGKYKGYGVDEVIRCDPEYLAWCKENLDWFELDQEADERLDEEAYTQIDWGDN